MRLLPPPETLAAYICFSWFLSFLWACAAWESAKTLRGICSHFLQDVGLFNCVDSVRPHRGLLFLQPLFPVWGWTNAPWWETAVARVLPCPRGRLRVPLPWFFFKSHSAFLYVSSSSCSCSQRGYSDPGYSIIDGSSSHLSTEHISLNLYGNERTQSNW